MKGRKAPQDPKPPLPPKKYVAFSLGDNRSIESAYQKLLENSEDDGTQGSSKATASKRIPALKEPAKPNTNLEDTGEEGRKKSKSVRVPVNEDFLFDVDIEERELAPAYWLGPVYDVRRGSWFYQEGLTLRPCEENLAAQLEEGYLRVKPWLYPSQNRSDSSGRQVTPKSSADNLKASSVSQDTTSKPPALVQHQAQTHRLFGTYMSQIATYHDASTAWLSSEGMLSWVTSTMYERFSGGGYMSGVKLVRGFAEPQKSKEEKRPSTPTGTKSTTSELDERQERALKRRSAPPSTTSETRDEVVQRKEDTNQLESRGRMLQRQLSSLLESTENRGSEDKEEAIRKREEEEIQDDYNPRIGETQGRDLEHLVLVTHGIGQLLGMRYVPHNVVRRALLTSEEWKA